MDAKFEEQKEKDKTPDSMLLTDRETSLNGIAAEHLYDIGGHLAELLDGLRTFMEQINELEQAIHDSASLGVVLPIPLPSSSSQERLQPFANYRLRGFGSYTCSRTLHDQSSPPPRIFCDIP